MQSRFDDWSLGIRFSVHTLWFSGSLRSYFTESVHHRDAEFHRGSQRFYCLARNVGVSRKSWTERQLNTKGRSFLWLAFDLDVSAVQVNNLPDD